MTPAEIIMRLYNAAPPVPDEDRPGCPPIDIEYAEGLVAMAAGGELDRLHGRALGVSLPAIEAGTETFSKYDEAYGRGAAARALK